MKFAKKKTVCDTPAAADAALVAAVAALVAAVSAAALDSLVLVTKKQTVECMRKSRHA